MPTGAGKSLTFQIPARILRGTVLVVSPLISLMKDQVDALARNGFRATVINSTLDPETRRDRLRRVRDGDYELVYVAPEGLEGNLRGFLAGVDVSLIVVDEAHRIWPSPRTRRATDGDRARISSPTSGGGPARAASSTPSAGGTSSR
ncbi:MAG: DEAD/DEAH box helicase [Deltaproteobacteria bacterium]|nr:MAG: DEAD/DEAH box helicase [Deltaproteobacteria bacterium]